jgi:hypothetical protein
LLGGFFEIPFKGMSFLEEGCTSARYECSTETGYNDEVIVELSTEDVVNDTVTGH